MKVKAKKCKGTGQATNSGCGKEVVKRIYGLCEPCYYDWLLNTEAGRIKLAKSTLQGKRNYERKMQEDKNEQRRSLNVLKKRLKTNSEWLNDLQRVFNKYIRTRDKSKPCVSCGTNAPNKQYDAGHYRNVGSHPELRFDENNVHRQCRKCNGYWGGNLIEYRKELIKRIGIEEVERLEGYNPPLKLSIPEIQEKIKYYKQKEKELWQV